MKKIYSLAIASLFAGAVFAQQNGNSVPASITNNNKSIKGTHAPKVQAAPVTTLPAQPEVAPSQPATSNEKATENKKKNTKTSGKK